ncbi:hypothetical protein [Spirosoma agri]|uniref:Uncharacterized protein n=1 Tax=Spirosoma agri TaxID=1987381 RepID=A0A6M0IPL8_9BACT|nr:hypothetical protein [Spirosoma agri]NEU70320.1 hypothetical protein [Spirosoma agri]
MRILIIYILLFAVLLPSISPLGTIAYYQVNRDYIARVLCENRNRPELHCNGQCYLAKRLKAQQDKQDKQTTEHVQNMPLIQLFCEAAFSINFGRPVQSDPSPQFAYLLSRYDSSLSRLLRPPRL